MVALHKAVGAAAGTMIATVDAYGCGGESWDVVGVAGVAAVEDDAPVRGRREEQVEEHMMMKR